MSSDWSFPSTPLELKSLTPFFQRAQELRVKDPVMAYWCTYFATKQAISLKASNKEVRPFLFHVMTILEQMKTNLGDVDAVSDDDAGAVYIENFALRVFSMADNEDRIGQATRSTAKKFLASANFFELLRIFDKPVEADIEEKIRYAKWKAADVAKAFREGRKPLSGDVATSPSPPPPPPESMLSPATTATLEPPQDSAPSMSAWSPGTSLAPSPAAPGIQSLQPSPISGVDVPLPQTVSESSSPEPVLPVSPSSPEQVSLPLLPKNDTPSTPSPRSFGAQLNLNRDLDGFVTPGMWSTMATPGTEDVYKASDAMGGISESPSVRIASRRNGVTANDSDPDGEAEPDLNMDAEEDAWSTAGNQSMSRQNSWSVVDNAPLELAPIASSSTGLGLQPDGLPFQAPVTPVKKVHFSPSVVGGLSSTSSSVAGSSPPASPERYAPSLPTVQEAGYSSDSDRDVVRHNPAICLQYDLAMHPLPESASSASEAESSPQGAPPVIHKIPSPTGHLSPNVPSSPYNMPKPSPPQFPAAPPQVPVTSSRGAGLSPLPPAPPTLHPTPRFLASSLGETYGYNNAPPKSPSPPPELTSTQVARIQKHCRFAISALDYEDVETARKELRSALAMLGS